MSNDADRFDAKVSPEPNTGCWLWSGAVTSPRWGLPYGVCRWGGKDALAHRKAWERANGPVPHGGLICHRCDTPPCVNPDHLYLGSVRSNTMDMVARGRGRGRVFLGESNGMAVLTAVVVASIKRKLAAGESVASLAAAYGVVPGAVYNIRAGLVWRHVEAA